MGTRHNSSIAVDPNDMLAKELESGIEHNAYLVLTADPASPASPARRRRWNGLTGRVVHEHTFDFSST